MGRAADSASPLSAAGRILNVDAVRAPGLHLLGQKGLQGRLSERYAVALGDLSDGRGPYTLEAYLTCFCYHLVMGTHSLCKISALFERENAKCPADRGLGPGSGLSAFP
jgi:hypothetical protein